MVVNRSALSAALLHDLRGYLSPYQVEYLESGNVWSDLPPAPGSSGCSFYAESLVRSVWKKFQDEIDQDAADAEAYRLFHEANDFCAREDLEVIDFNQLGPADSEILGQLKQELWMFFNPEGFPLFAQLTDEEIPNLYAEVDFGPGNAPGASRTSFLHKLGSSQLTATSSFIIADYYRWCEKASVRFSNEICRSMTTGRAEVESKPSRLVAVPKTTKVSRLVKTEPLLNMFFQKGIQSVLEHRLRAYWDIDLATQPALNSELARLGSIDGSYATIDLTQCSDYISRRLVASLIDRVSFFVLDRYRSPQATVNGCAVRLNMMATMGNAYCFPLQTIVLSALVRAVYKCLGIPLVPRRKSYSLANGVLYRSDLSKNWGVFGDDIIVVRDAYPTVIRILKALRLVPNESKSFWTGDFRESCGSDWKNGENVRGVYIKTLKTPQNLAVAFNSLTEWSVKSKVCLTTTLAFLYRAREDWPMVPLWENPDAGLRLPLNLVKEVMTLGKVDGLWGSLLYRKWVGKPISYDRTRGYHNPFALLMSASLGKLRRGLEIVRPKVLRYGTVYGVAPSWDVVPGDSLHQRETRMSLLSTITGL